MKNFKKILLLIIFVAFILVIASCTLKEYALTVFYTSDMHGHMTADDDTIGIDTIAALKKQNPNSFLFDTGDFSHGLPLATLTKGYDVITLMKEAGYDVAAVGNHEFDYGTEFFKENIDYASSGDNSLDIMSANIYKTDGQRALTPYTIKTQNGVKIGIFALTTLETYTQAVPGSLSGFEFKDPYAEAEKVVSDLKNQKCAVIIALTHLGSLDELGPHSRDIAKISGIDIVIDGHSHVELEEERDDEALVVSPGSYGEKIGQLEISYNKKGVIETNNTLLDKETVKDVTPSENITAKLNEITAKQDTILKEVIATTPFNLNAEKGVVRTVETNLGNIMADAMIAASGADFAIANAGGIRASISAGDITMGDVLTTFPYCNLIVTKRITGEELKEILEHAYSLLPVADGRFAQIGGLKVTVDISKPAGERILSLTKTDGTSIEMSTGYVLAINEYIGAGGDSYPVLADLPVLYQGATEDQVFATFLNSTDLSPYSVTLGRIIFS